MGQDSSVPAISGGGLVPVLGVGATIGLPGMTAQGGGAGLVNIHSNVPGAIPVVTAESGPTLNTVMGVSVTIPADTWTVSTARSDTGVAVSVPLHVLFFVVPALR